MSIKNVEIKYFGNDCNEYEFNQICLDLEKGKYVSVSLKGVIYENETKDN